MTLQGKTVKVQSRAFFPIVLHDTFQPTSLDGYLIKANVNETTQSFRIS